MSVADRRRTQPQIVREDHTLRAAQQPDQSKNQISFPSPLRPGYNLGKNTPAHLESAIRSAVQMRMRNSALWIFVAGFLLFSGCGEGSPPQSSQTVPEKSNGQPVGDSNFSPNSDGATVTPSNVSPEPQAEPPADMTIVMEDCKASRPGKITGGTSVLRMLFSGPPQERLIKRGTVRVDGEDYTLYLPKAESYSTKNTEPGDSDFENTSTRISVDHNGDSRLTHDEGWFANLPLRLGEKMFDVAEIAEDGSRVMLRPSKSPLRGVIVGRTCPSFSFKTANGDEVSFETLAGKAFILDPRAVPAFADDAA